MAIVVNTNVSSYNAQRSLAKNDRLMSTALERLASGLRINKSGDDAAGLAIATGMSTQIRGLTMAQRNTTDARSVIGMADGAVNTQTEILQRIRELAVQASSDLNSTANRETIQQEIQQQISELTRVAQTTEFNGLTLIDGTFTNKNIQVGANAGEIMEISLGDFRASRMGSYASKTSAAQMTMAATAEMTSGSVKINSVDVGPAESDGVSFAFKNFSAIAKADAINSHTSETGVTAVAEATELTGGAVTAATVATNDIFKINGETIIDGSSDAGVVISASDSDFMLSTRINSVSHLTGVTAELDAGKLKMTAADGRNILVDVANLTETGFGNVFGSTNVNAANQAAGKVTLYSSDLIELNVTNEDVLELATQNVAVDRVNNRVDKIDVTTFESANNAIRIIDSALEDITNAQAQLGALSNRLVNTVDNLAVSIENMQASRSRIMDADFALETSNLTRAQILQQSGTAVLAQANLKPQAALSLLG
jgi:flagellin